MSGMVERGSEKAMRSAKEKTATLRNAALCAAAMPLLWCAAAWGQVERPALMIGNQGGGPAPATGSITNVGGLTDEPFSAGQVVHVLVFNALDFSVTARVSEAGEVPVPMLGEVHVAGLNSAQAGALIGRLLKEQQLMNDPHVQVTVDSASTGITVLGEVRAPGIYPPPGKNLLSDVIAMAGGLTANTGRVIEISNNRKPGEKEEIPWDPTMHNTANYDRKVSAGDRVLVRSCGIAYIGGHVMKPGAYSLCGSTQITMSQLVALAGGMAPLTSDKHVYLIRMQQDGSKAAQEVNLHKVLVAKAADPVLREDDIVYITPSTLKDALTRSSAWALSVSGSLIYAYH